MDARERDRLIALITNPPPGSKLAAAKAFGIDLTLIVENLALTPTQRLEKWRRAQAFHAELRRAGEQARLQ